MDDGNIEKKQNYLRQEIIEKGYSPEEFANFLDKIKGDNAADLNSYTLEDLSRIVQQFKESKEQIKKEILKEEPKEQIKHEIKKEESNEPVKKEIPREDNKEIKQQEIKKEKSKDSENKEILNEEYIGNEDEDLWGNKIENKTKQSNLMIKCRKFENSELLNNREKLRVQIINVEIKKDGLFSSSYYEFSIKNELLNIDFKRRTNDFIWLKNKLTIFFPNIFIPPLPKIKTKKDEEYIQKKIYYLQSFINHILNNDILLSSQIFQDFISLSYNEFKNSREAFDMLTPPKVPEDMITIDGNLDVSVLAEIDKKTYDISNEIAKKYDLYNKLNIYLKEVIDIIYQLKTKYLEISNIFNQLSHFDSKSEIIKNDKTNYYFTKLKGIFINSATEYEKKINYFEVYIRRFFKYIKDEINEFNYMYKNYDKIRTTFIDATDKKYFAEDDNFKSLKKNFGFILNSVYSEYKNLAKVINLRIKEHFSDNSKFLNI